MTLGNSILVAGHTGLIGSALCRRLSERSPGNENTDYIIHAAGYASPAKFMADPMATIAVNTTRLMAMIEAMQPGARLMFLSSSEVYSGSAASTHTEDDIGTTTPEHPRAAYIEGKRCGEAICHAARAAGRDVVIARVSSVYGPGFRRDDTRVLPQFIRMAVEERCVAPKGGADARRGWLYVDDCADMLLTILEHGTQAVYNVGGTEQCSIAELAAKIADMAPCSYQAPSGVGTAGAPSHVKVDMTRYNQEFGAPSLKTLDEGIGMTLDWYRGAFA